MVEYIEAADGRYVQASDYDALAARLAEAERERDEYRARAVSLLAFVPDDVRCGQVQDLRDEYARWRASDKGAVSHICGTPDAMCDTDCMARSADSA